MKFVYKFAPLVLLLIKFTFISVTKIRRIVLLHIAESNKQIQLLYIF